MGCVRVGSHLGNKTLEGELVKGIGGGKARLWRFWAVTLVQ